MRGPMRLIVYGIGAVGGVVGARLHEGGHDVLLIARGEQLTALRADGLVVETPDGSTRLDLPVVDHPGHIGFTDSDVVLLTVKSQHTRVALDMLVAHAPPDTPVVCVQNGVGNEQAALRQFPNAYGVAVMCPASFLQPGVVQAYSTPITGILDIGRYPAGSDDTAERIAAAFNRSGFLSEVRADIMRWKYRKLLTNLGNAIEAICGPETRRGRIGELATVEGEGVLKAAGIEVASPEEDRLRRGDHLDVRPIKGKARSGGSVWQSLTRSTGSVETDYLNGEIVLLGRLHRIPTPVNELLQRLSLQVATDHMPPGQLPEDDFLKMVSTATNSVRNE